MRDANKQNTKQTIHEVRAKRLAPADHNKHNKPKLQLMRCSLHEQPTKSVAKSIPKFQKHTQNITQ